MFGFKLENQNYTRNEPLPSPSIKFKSHPCVWYRRNAPKKVVSRRAPHVRRLSILPCIESIDMRLVSNSRDCGRARRALENKRALPSFSSPLTLSRPPQRSCQASGSLGAISRRASAVITVARLFVPATHRDARSSPSTRHPGLCKPIPCK
jgi:hypothetical protein